MSDVEFSDADREAYNRYHRELQRKRADEGIANGGARATAVANLPSVKTPEDGIAYIEAMLLSPDVPDGVKERLIGHLPKYFAAQDARRKLTEVESEGPDEFEAKILRMRGEAV